MSVLCVLEPVPQFLNRGLRPILLAGLVAPGQTVGAYAGPNLQSIHAILWPNLNPEMHPILGVENCFWQIFVFWLCVCVCVCGGGGGGGGDLRISIGKPLFSLYFPRKPLIFSILVPLLLHALYMLYIRCIVYIVYSINSICSICCI